MFMVDPIMQMAIPFLFVFAVIFGVLELTLRSWSTPVKAVIALALAFFSISYQPFTSFLWAQMGNITFFFIFMFFLAFMIEIVGLKKTEKPDEQMIITAVVLLLLLTIGWMLIDIIPFDIPIFENAEDLLLLIGIIVIVTIFFAAYKAGTFTSQAKAIVESQRG